MRLIPIALLAAFALPAAPALADRPGPNWISSQRASNILRQRGYRVTKIEADDGHWEGEAYRNGRKYEFHVAPRSGRITKLERD